MQPGSYGRILTRLEAAYQEGRLRNRTDSISLFAEITEAGITQEEFRSVRKLLGRVLRHSRAIRRALRQGDEQIGKIEEALSSKPVTTLSELGNQVGEGWLVHQETAFLEAAKEELEAEGLRLREESKTLKESINKYHDLMDAWNEFARWVACNVSPRTKS